MQTSTLPTGPNTYHVLVRVRVKSSCTYMCVRACAKVQMHPAPPGRSLRN